MSKRLFTALEFKRLRANTVILS